MPAIKFPVGRCRPARGLVYGSHVSCLVAAAGILTGWVDGSPVPVRAFFVLSILLFALLAVTAVAAGPSLARRMRVRDPLLASHSRSAAASAAVAAVGLVVLACMARFATCRLNMPGCQQWRAAGYGWFSVAGDLAWHGLWWALALRSLLLLGAMAMGLPASGLPGWPARDLVPRLRAASSAFLAARPMMQGQSTGLRLGEGQIRR